MRRPALAVSIVRRSRRRIVKIDRSLEACDTNAIRLVMLGGGAMLITAVAMTNVISFLIGLVALLACGTMIEQNFRRGSFPPLSEPVRAERARVRRVTPRR